LSESWIRGALSFGFVLKLPFVISTNTSSAAPDKLSEDVFGFVLNLVSNFVWRTSFKTSMFRVLDFFNVNILFFGSI